MIGFLKRSPFLAGLVVVLILISFSNLRPGWYLMGWDNYSSYFNLNNSIWRTLLATWREYRGLGVPSDAEVTDIFRLIFNWLTHWLVPEAMLDQLYYLVALWLGVGGMYFLAREMFAKLGKRFLDLAGGVAAFLYLFNLNTLSVFYSPLIPFTNRFWGLPLTLWSLIRLAGNWSRKNLLIWGLIVLFSSGSYITPTVIITNLLALFIFGLAKLNLKKTIIFGGLFLALNAFWILPFINYSKEKSAIVPLARTFVEINETTLNRPVEVFSFEKQVTMYPSFMDMSFPSIEGATRPIHPLLNEFKSEEGRWRLLLFPIIYGVGSWLILMRAVMRREKGWWWVPFWIVVFLFLSMKEFGVLGGVYAWLKVNIPYFEIIFRISDTKFHAYINLAGSLAGAYAVVRLGELMINKGVWKYGAVVVLSGLAGLYAWSFRSYVGNLVIDLAYNKVPTAYWEMAQVINSDKEPGRVLHLPMSLGYEYWRSYSWGYLGSAFFNFMIDKPYIDRTFEPGSMENSYANNKIGALIDDYYGAGAIKKKEEQLNYFAEILTKMGVRYVVVDRSIGSDILSKNLFYGAKQQSIKSQAVMDKMTEKGRATKVNSYLVEPGSREVTLYKLKQVEPMVAFKSEGQQVSANLDNLLESSLANQRITWKQKSGEAGTIWPFLEQNHRVKTSDELIELDFDDELGSDYVVVSGKSSEPYLIDIFGKLVKKGLELSFFNRYYPNINDKEYRQPLGVITLPIGELKLSSENGYWLGEGKDISQSEVVENYRLEINGLAMVLPALKEEEEKKISSVMIEEKKIRASLLEKVVEEKLGLTDFGLAQPEVCFGPQLSGYLGSAKVVDSELVVMAKRGAMCVHNVLMEKKGDYLEYNLMAKGSGDKPEKVEEVGMAKELRTMGEEVKRGYVCIKQWGENNDCLNGHRDIRLFEDYRHYRIPVSTLLEGTAPVIINVGLIPEGMSQQQMVIKERIAVDWFKEKEGDELVFETKETEEKVAVDGKLRVSWPQALSKYSYRFHPEYEMRLIPQEECRGGSTRVQRVVDGTFFNLMDTCSVYVAAPLKYNSNNPYLVSVDYWVGSGQQPHLVLGRSGYDYLTERLSLYQGYPNLAKMRQFEDPQTKVGLTTVELSSASRLIEPMVKLNGVIREANLHIFQDGDNQGLIAVGAFQISDYPGGWQELAIRPAGANKEYSQPKVLAVKQYLPSLWRVDYEGTGEEALLAFNQGYDRQWVTVGKKSENYRCNGATNCFELKTERGKERVWIFYWPEVLAMAGWGVSLGTLSLMLIFLRKLKTAAAK